jgi:hypothetical protein
MIGVVTEMAQYVFAKCFGLKLWCAGVPEDTSSVWFERTRRNLEAELGTVCGTGSVLFGVAGTQMESGCEFSLWIFTAECEDGSNIEGWIADIDIPYVSLSTWMPREAGESDASFFGRTCREAGLVTDVGLYVRMCDVESTSVGVRGTEFLEDFTDVHILGWRKSAGVIYAEVVVDSGAERAAEDRFREGIEYEGMVAGVV